MRSAVNASTPPVEVLELCDSGGHVVLGCVGVLVEALCVHPLTTAGNLASTLVDALQQFDEARAFLRDRIPEAIRTLGKNHGTTFRLERMHAQCLYQNDGASREDVTAAIATLEDIDRRQTRIYGASHPQTLATRGMLEKAREKLARAK